MPQTFFRLLCVFPVLGAFLLMGGCTTTHADRAKTLAPYELHNVYKTELPKDFKRVALLPIVTSPDMGVADSLNSIKASITEELHKAKKYEIIDIDTDTLREWTGRGQLTSLDIWPDTLKTALATRQADGVILIELTQLKGYQPIAMGIKARLVSLSDGKTLWACDEVFDLATPEVYAGAKRFESGSLLQTGNSKSPGSIEMSPSLVAKYAAFTIFGTLP